ncbi:MAG TPA: hypothetical protein VF110_15460 [Burkholderiales bacterium]
MRALLLPLLLPLSALAQLSPQQVEIQRALIQRDQQSAEFAARGVEARRALENLNAAQLRDAGVPLSPDPVIARELQSYQRQAAERERMVLPPIDQPAKPGPPAPALPLPGSGGPPSVVVPISTPSIGG